MQKETLILASNNAGKLREMREILEPFGLEVRSQKEAGFTADIAETGTTFQENAIIKAKPAAAKGQYIKSISLAPTMGPGVKVNVAKVAQ